jgi:5-methylcytosine-specific restriction endonuclease McrA
MFKLANFSTKAKVVGKTRNYGYGTNWDIFSNKIKEERGRQCQRCGSRKNLQNHHIVPLSRGGANTRANQRVLCKPCHDLNH